MKTLRLLSVFSVVSLLVFETWATDTISRVGYIERDRVVGELAGSWENPGYAADVITATHGLTEAGEEYTKIRVQLNADFSYIRHRVSEEGVVMDRGVWHVSEDGRTLFFQNTVQEKVDYVRIRYLNLDEMVLELPAVGGASVGRHVFFNKR